MCSYIPQGGSTKQGITYGMEENIGIGVPECSLFMRDLDASKLEMLSSEIGLSEAIPMAGKLLEGKVRGRVLVDISR